MSVYMMIKIDDFANIFLISGRKIQIINTKFYPFSDLIFGIFGFFCGQYLNQRYHFDGKSISISE